MDASVLLPILVDAAKPMFGALSNRLKEDIRLFKGFEEKLSNLHNKIQPIANVVHNMATDADKDEAVKSWLIKVIRILHNWEDLLDVLAYEKQRAVFMKRMPLQLYSRSKTGKWISKINDNIVEALKDIDNIVQLKALERSSYPLPAQALPASDRLQQLRHIPDMSMFVGRESNVDFLVDKLCTPDRDCDHVRNNRLSVVAIVAFGGIGKTVLAKKVFEEKRVLDRFTQRIWIAVSNDFDIAGILNKMLEFVDKNSRGIARSNEIVVRNLKEKLEGMRYLLVLDDVWNTYLGLWNAMKSSLESIGGSQDSMILVTTRDKAVAQTMHASSIHELPELSEDDSWSLFKQIAFANMSPEYISMLETTGKKIVRKCKGVALAIKSIGGILQTKRHAYEWENIEQSELWDLPQDDTGILPSLKLSYDYLPSPFLKKCFSFCAILPKDLKFGKKWMIYCWMALGLIQQFDYNRVLMEDIAEEYVNALLRISFLHEEERDELGEISYYGMHDLVHDLARSVSRNEVLLLEADDQVETITDVRHLALYGHVEVTSYCWDKLVLENLRTLDVNDILPRGLLKHVKYLRVLHLQQLGLQVVPKSIAGLKCLKYLNLSGNPIKVLPEFITELYSLQTLILDRCKLLKKLPGGLCNLVNLRHLLIDQLISLPAGMIGQSRCLQTLPPLSVSDGRFKISELGCLHHISGDLEIYGLEHIRSKEDAEAANLSEKSRVKRLRLFWNSDDDWIKHEKVLDGLIPNRNLRLLTIDGYGGEKFPTWLRIMDISKEPNYLSVACNLITIIELVDCRRCQHLPTLGHLPFLEKLKIKNMGSLEYIGAELYHYAEAVSKAVSSSSSFGVNSTVYFPRLKQLHLCGLHSLTKWCEPSSGVWTIFPSLEILVMEDCPKLTVTPNEFPSLKQLTIKNNKSGHPVSNILANKSSLSCLKNLHIEGVVELTTLSQQLTEYCTSLQTLKLEDCQKLTCLPEPLSKLNSLEALGIWRCPNLESLPNLSSLASLCRLDIFRNDVLKCPPDDLQSCILLEKLWLSACPKIETLPDLTALARLDELCIRGMPQMISQLPDWMRSLSCLTRLHIGSYFNQDHFPDISPLLNIPSLDCLMLYGWDNLHSESLPEQLQYFTALNSLVIVSFRNLECLPSWIGNLSSLQDLSFEKCKKLKKLASKDAMKRLTKLSYLIIADCPLLEKATDTVNGTEHHKISHIDVQIENSTD